MTYNNKIHKVLLRDLKDSAQEFIDKGVVLPLKVKDYYQALNGERSVFEQLYFARRKQLGVLAGSLFLGLTDKVKTLELLEQTIWEICNEFAWGVPAHLTSTNGDTYKESNKTLIDLFASETGQTLAEILTIIGDQLSPFIKNRIHEEIENRIFQSFLLNDWEWEHRHDNWSAVIAGCIGMTALDILEKGSEKQRRILNKLNIALDNYMGGFAEDGACFEGAGYWSYGFGYYVYFAEKYNRVLDDDRFLKHAKAKAISKFPYNALISKDRFVPYSDTGTVSIPSGLMNFCKDYFGATMPAYTQTSDFEFSSGYKWANLYRNLIWTKEPNRINNKNDHYFKDVEWLVIRNEETKFSFSAIGGENNSHHNHNDVGNFIIGNGSELFLTDIGGDRYVTDYFLPIKRYESLNARSLGHSVPLINNKEQINVEKPEYYHMHDDNKFEEFFAKHDPNAKYKATNVIYNKDKEKHSLTMNLESAYHSDAMIKNYSRAFEVDENQRTVHLSENINFENQQHSSVSQGFVSLIKPQIKDDSIEWSLNGDILILKYDNSLDKVILKEEVTKTYVGTKTTVYIIRLENKDENISYVRSYEFKMV